MKPIWLRSGRPLESMEGLRLRIRALFWDLMETPGFGGSAAAGPPAAAKYVFCSRQGSAPASVCA